MATTPVEVKKTALAPTAPDAWRSLRGEMDRLFDRFASGFGMPAFGRMFDAEPAFRFEAPVGVPSPAMDITEDDTAYKLTAELPGMAEKEIEVALTDDMLTIKGEKKQEQEKQDRNTYLSERSYGLFQRSFALPGGVDRNAITADFAKGVLTVVLPKTAQAQADAKKIEVKAAA